MLESALGLDALALFADGERDRGLRVDLLHAEWDLDVIKGAGETARRLQEQIRDRRRFLAGELGAVRRRHAGTEHLIDMLLKVLRGVEHLPRPGHRRQRAQAREL